MKNLKKILALLLALTMLFALCACGGDTKDTESGKESTSTTDKNTDKETKTISGNTEKETGDDDIVLPEDGKITFSKDNGKSNKDDSSKDNTGKDSGNTSSKTTKPEETTKPTDSETTKPTDDGSSTGGNPADDGGWGGVNWNN